MNMKILKLPLITLTNLIIPPRFISSNSINSQLDLRNTEENINITNSKNTTLSNSTDSKSYAEEMYPLVITLWCIFIVLMTLIWWTFYREKKVDESETKPIKEDSTPI